MRRLCRFAVRKELISVDPTIGIARYAENPDGYHTWTDLRHRIQGRPCTALDTKHRRGQAGCSLFRMAEYQRWAYRLPSRGKTAGDVDLPVLDELREVLAMVPRGRMLFITHTGDRPYEQTSFGNWFHDQCIAVGLPQCSAHGLRKAGATRLANAGAT